MSEILSGVGQIYLSDKKHEQKQCIKENYLSLSKIAYTELSERINPTWSKNPSEVRKNKMKGKRRE